MRARTWPTPWLFAVLILPLGIYSGFINTPLPFLLSRSGVSVDRIARLNSFLLAPSAFSFLLTPIVDTAMRRRTWLFLSSLAGAVCMCVSLPLLGPQHLTSIAGLLFCGFIAVTLGSAAVGGLMVTALPLGTHAKASAWYQAGNFGAGALVAVAILWLTSHVSLPLVVAGAAAMIVLPGSAALSVPEAPYTRRGEFRARLAELGGEIAGLVRSRDQLWGVLLLVSPVGAGAAQSLLPAIASHYNVGLPEVLWVNGVTGALVLALGALAAALLPGHWSPLLTYAGAGASNAIASMILAAGHGRSTYLAGTVLYLITLGFCNSRFIFLVVHLLGGHPGHVSAKFGILCAAGNLSVTYMLWLDGIGFQKFGVNGLLWTDAAGNLIVFAIVLIAFLGRQRPALPAEHDEARGVPD